MLSRAPGCTNPRYSEVCRGRGQDPSSPAPQGAFPCHSQIPAWQGTDGCCHPYYNTGKLFTAHWEVGRVRAGFHTSHSSVNTPATPPDSFCRAVLPDTSPRACSWCPQQPQLQQTLPSRAYPSLGPLSACHGTFLPVFTLPL